LEEDAIYGVRTAGRDEVYSGIIAAVTPDAKVRRL
jgi:hypothetical protein